MKSPISPKILAGANAAAFVGLLLTLLDALGPGSLDFLGKWAPLAYAAVAIITFAGAAYLKTDSIREAGLAALQKAAEEAAAAAEQAKQTSLAATATNAPAPAVSFASTQAKLDALAQPLPEEYVPLDKPADPATA